MWINGSYPNIQRQRLKKNCPKKKVFLARKLYFGSPIAEQKKDNCQKFVLILKTSRKMKTNLVNSAQNATFLAKWNYWFPPSLFVFNALYMRLFAIQWQQQNHSATKSLSVTNRKKNRLKFHFTIRETLFFCTPRSVKFTLDLLHTNPSALHSSVLLHCGFVWFYFWKKWKKKRL